MMKLVKIQTGIEVYRNREGQVVECKEIFEDVLMENPLKLFFKDFMLYVSLFCIGFSSTIIYTSNKKFEIVVNTVTITALVLNIIVKYFKALDKKRRYYDSGGTIK